MDSFHKPSASSFDGNTSENWRRFRQQSEISLTASAREKKDDTVKIAISSPAKMLLRCSIPSSFPRATRKARQSA